MRVHKSPALKALVREVFFHRVRPDVVHLHWIGQFNSWGMGLVRAAMFILRLCLLRLTGIPLIWTVHNLLPHESRCRRLDWSVGWLTARLARRLIVHSATSRAEVVKAWGLRPSKPIHVVPHPNYIGCYANTVTREQARERLGISPSKIVLLFVGYVRPYKGVLELIESFKSLNDASTFLLIAGKPLDDSFARVVSEAGAGNDNIGFHAGFVEDDEVQVYMNAADVVVLPYRRTLSSGAVMLAMSFGKPCAAPALPGIADLLDASTAFLYDPDREDGLTDALKQACEDRHRLAEMGRRNRERAEGYSWEAAARATAEVYRQSCTETARGEEQSPGSTNPDDLSGSGHMRRGRGGCSKTV